MGNVRGIKNTIETLSANCFTYQLLKQIIAKASSKQIMC